MRCPVCDCTCKIGRMFRREGKSYADFVCRNPRCTEYDMVVEESPINVVKGAMLNVMETGEE